MIKSQLARKIAANLGTVDVAQAPTAFYTSTAATALAVPAVDAPESLVNNGGVDNGGELASNSSGEEIQNSLIRPASPDKTRESSTVPAVQSEKVEEDTADHMRKLLGDIVTHSRAAIKAGDDKVALAVTAYSWVSLAYYMYRAYPTSF